MAAQHSNSDLAGLREQITDNVKVAFPFYHTGVLGNTSDVPIKIIMGYSNNYYNAIVVWGADNKEFLRAKRGATPQAALQELLHSSCELVTENLFREEAKELERKLERLDNLPPARLEIAKDLSAVLIRDFDFRMRSKILNTAHGLTAKDMANMQASCIEHALSVSHGGPDMPGYRAQFRSLLKHLSENKVLVARLLDGTLTEGKMSTMSTEDMASENF